MTQKSSPNGRLTDEQQQLEELRRLLTGNDRDVLDELVQRLKSPDARANDVAEVLVEAIRIRQKENNDFANAIEQPVTASVKKSIERDADYFAAIIFPVIGPAIRKYIAEALKSFIQNINTTVENSLSPKSLGWRMEALMTNRSFGEVVLKHTLVYRVEQVFLMERSSGLLMQHVAREDVQAKDSDAVSAMFSAIQSFVQDSFGDGETNGLDDALESVEVGDQTVWLTNMNGYTLACVIRGIAPLSLRSDLEAVLEDICRQHNNDLENFNGDRDTLSLLEPDLRRCFEFEKNKQDLDTVAPQKTIAQRLLGVMKTPFFYIALLLLGLLLWSVWVHWQERQQRNALLEKMDAIPGVLVTDTGWESKRWYMPNRRLLVYGLEDKSIYPYADSLLGGVFEQPKDDVRLQLKSYRSLDEEVVLQRLKQRLQPPSGVVLNYNVAQQKVSLSGRAPKDWYVKWAGKPLNVLGVESSDWSAVTVDNQAELTAFDKTKQKVEAQIFGFNVAYAASEGFAETAKMVATDVKKLNALADALGKKVRVNLLAYSDNVGSPRRNKDIRDYRADLVKKSLIREGLSAAQLNTLDGGAQGELGEIDKSLRRVLINIQVLD